MRSREAHLAVVAAIEDFDGETARRLTVAHIAGAIEWLLDAKAELERRG